MAWADLSKFLRTRTRIWNYINQLIDNTDWLKDNIGGGGSGDMLKSVYDTDDDSIVDASETVTDGTSDNLSTAAEIRSAIDDIDSIMNGGSVQGSYKTGWVYETDFSAVEFSYTHNLNSNLSDLIVKIFVSPDGTDENALEVGFGLRYVDASAQSAGLTVYQVSTNEIKIETATAGIVAVNESNGVTLIASNYYIKVAIYKMGDVLVSTPTLGIHDTGWVQVSDGNWLARDLGDALDDSVYHNLDGTPDQLIVKFMISNTGEDSTAREVPMNALDYSSSIAAVYGVQIRYIDTNILRVVTATNGVNFLNSAGAIQILDSETYYYRIVVYKLGNISIIPAEAFEVKNVAADYTLTSANNGVRELRVTPSTADITITLPYRSIRYGIDLKVINCGDGTYSVNVVTQGAETINGTSSVEITEANGWWKFCPGNATSTEWKTETDGESTVYLVASETADTGLSLDGSWDTVSGMSILPPAGIYDIEAEGEHYGYDVATIPSYMYTVMGLGTSSGSAAPNLRIKWDGIGLNSSITAIILNTQKIRYFDYEFDGSTTIYMKAALNENAYNASSHQMRGSANRSMYIRLRRKR